MILYSYCISGVSELIFLWLIVCSAVISLRQVNVTRLRSFIPLAMFDLKLEWMVGGGREERWEKA